MLNEVIGLRLIVYAATCVEVSDVSAASNPSKVAILFVVLENNSLKFCTPHIVRRLVSGSMVQVYVLYPPLEVFIDVATALHILTEL